MTDEEYLRKNLGAMQSKLTLKECMAVSWALAEIDELRSTEHSDAAKWRAATHLASQQDFNIETAKAALLNYSQRIDDVTAERDALKLERDSLKQAQLMSHDEMVRGLRKWIEEAVR